MTDEIKQNPSEIRSISEAMTKKPSEIYGEFLKKGFTHDWVFERFYEKLIITLCAYWTFFSIIKWIWRLF